ncbi:TonB-dependent receptor [Frateuria sp. Soil773]|uniref:TonB-dependent receptor n=1 Tax=Frateuria sp. Soil773 TaxID=1736407 RepID=UPI0006F90DBA|nr:TonB-dependent receptor [Frateuria sp. Soil773]KRF02004.1 TonB-dependent receptor [Frateuria sp. Soil773]
MSMRQRPLSISLRRLLFGGSALLLCAPAAFAAAPQEAAGSQADAADPAKAKLLGNIVVTAQSRSQEMQEVPIPLQIVTAKQVDTLAATDLSRMDIFVPGLVVSGDQPTQPSYQLRGIQTSDFGVGTESAVGVYIDGVYAARSGGALLAFNDIARIEVLKGPQGTLFGRNAAAGAISIVTNEPSDRFEGKARLRFGNYGRRYGDALLNLPVNKDMALRVSVLDNQSDGWIKDAASGKRYGKDDDWGSRVAWRWNVTSNTRVLLSWDHERLKQPPKPAIGLIPLDADSNQRPPFPDDPAGFLNPLHARLYNDTVDAAETRRFDGATLSIDHSFDWGSLTSTTAWRHFNTLNRGDYDGTNHIVSYLDTANIERNTSWYQEFKLAGSNDLADWVAGASWYDERARQTSQTNIFTDSLDTLVRNVMGLGTPLTDISNGLAAMDVPYTLLGDPWHEAISNVGRFKAYAGYGDVIWHLTDRLNITTGIRYTRDQKSFSWYNMPRRADEFDATVGALRQAGVIDMLPPEAQFALAAFGSNVIFNDGSGAPIGVLAKRSDRWSNLSPRVVLDYKFTPDVMGYASVTKGYKAGGYNSVQIGSRFAPEKVINYEAGLKTVFPDQHLLLNGSAYYYRYDNKQSLTLDPNSAGSGVPRYLVSSTDQQAKGLELEAQWQPVDAFRLSFTGAWIDATYRHAVAASGVDLSDQPTGEPKVSFAAGLSYTWRNVAGGALQFDLSHAYRGKSRCNRDSQLQGECQISPNFDNGAAQQRTDARLDWSSAGDHWGVALYANNVFDKRYVTGVSNITSSVFGTPYATITPPRMWGVELRAKF